jgi:protein-tyrosine-phosphatase
MPGKQRVLFLCTGNSARSQMAEALLRQIAGDDYIAYSAGTHPRGIDTRTIEVMDEIDLDIRQQKSKDIALFVDQQFDYVITLCGRAKETCPAFPGVLKLSRKAYSGIFLGDVTNWNDPIIAQSNPE